MSAHDSQIQTMAPAPWLAPVSDEEGADPGPLRTVAPPPPMRVTRRLTAPEAGYEAAPVAAPATVQQTVTPAVAGHPGAAAVPVSPLGRVLAGVADQQARLSSMHQQFLASQAEMHRQFLSMHERVSGRIRQQVLGTFQPGYDPGMTPGAGYEAGHVPAGYDDASAGTMAGVAVDPYGGGAGGIAAEAASPVAPAGMSAGMPAMGYAPSVPEIAPAVSPMPAVAPPAGAPSPAASSATGTTSAAPVQARSGATSASTGLATPKAVEAVTAKAPPKVEPATPPRPVRPGPRLDRSELEAFASGRTTSLKGLSAEGTTGFARAPRLPTGQLLLIDRITGATVDRQAGTATVWTETDVRDGRWFVGDEGRMPPGLVLEAAQGFIAGIDALGAPAGSSAVCRPLAMDVTFHHSLPRGEDLLNFEIRVDRDGDGFRWQADGLAGDSPRITVRNGRIGLAGVQSDASVTWDPETATPTQGGRFDAPSCLTDKRTFSADDVRAFAEGLSGKCFGPLFRMARAHSRSPASPRGVLQVIQEVPVFDPEGGPWGRGYLRAETPISADTWFFVDQLGGDKAMPASFMLEGAFQALEFYLVALGFSIYRDGWRLEPSLDEALELRFYGQATSKNRLLTWEVFVDEVDAGPNPTLHAAVRMLVDGKQVFHVARAGMRLVLEHPLEHWRRLGPHRDQPTATIVPLRDLGGLVGYEDPRALRLPNGFPLDYVSMISGSWGSPADTYGDLYKNINGMRRMPRGPAPPYQFLSRVISLDGPLGQMKAGLTVELEYDVPERVWYWDVNGYPVMAWCVFMEIVLQGCGWLAIGLGTFNNTDEDLMFRNLDGTGTLTKEITPTSGTLRVKIKVTNISRSAGIEIQSFQTSCYLGDDCIYTMDTVFGFFPPEAFENQVGLPVTPEQKARIAEPANLVVDLTTAPAKYCDGYPRLAGTMLRMLDRINGYWPEGGKKGLGYVRGEKDINPDEWFFKAHFFRDPVQPGSLGHEAFVQLIQWVMIERGMGEGIPHARFEPIMLDRKLWWRYRGQITPKNFKISTELEITEIGTDEKGPYAVGDAWLWVDGKCIYAARNLGMRIVPGEPRALSTGPANVETVLDTEVDPWIKDHCPTWTMPSLPAMSMVDLITEAAENYAGRKATGLSSVQVRRWLPFPKSSVPIRTEVTGSGDVLESTLLAWREAANPAMSRFEVVASGKVHFGPLPERPAPWAPLEDAQPSPSPYGDYLFHGPCFQMLVSNRIGPTGASAILHPGLGSVRFGALNQGVLDAATHAIPHGHLEQWDAQIAPGQVGYPYRVPYLHQFEPLPTSGEVRVEVRFAGFDGDVRTPIMEIQMISEGRVFLAMRLVEVLLPQGRLMQSTAEQRLGFLVERKFVPDLTLSELDGPVTRLKASEVSLMDWIPGNVAWAFGIPREQRVDLNAQVAIREHISQRAKIHPYLITVEDDLTGGITADRPMRRFPVQVVRKGTDLEVIETGPPQRTYDPIRAYWHRYHGLELCAPEDIYEALGRFVGEVVVADPEGFNKVKGQNVLYFANHQTGIESLVFTILSQALTEIPCAPLAKAEHKTSYLQWLWTHSESYPGVRKGHSMIFFEREDLASLLGIIEQLERELVTISRSVLIHVEGTRALTCRHPVKLLSSAFLDLAVKTRVPIVPVRLIGGLPVEPLETRSEFPYGFGRQDYWIGSPIIPEQLETLRYRDRKQLVLEAMNNLGNVPLSEETPFEPDPEFGAEVSAWMARTGATLQFATIYVALTRLPNPGPEIRALLDGAKAGRLVVDGSPRGQWIEGLARKLFGERGPAIVRG